MRVPIRSDNVPLIGATAAINNGWAVNNSPACAGLMPRACSK
jgi:hypothetical protein